MSVHDLFSLQLPAVVFAYGGIRGAGENVSFLGGGDDNLHCTCTHVGCYATGLGWGGDENLPCILAQNRMHNKSKETRLINDQIWEYLYSWQWRRNVGKVLWSHMPEVFAEGK